MAEQTNTEVISAFTRIPYALINTEVSGSANDTLAEFTEICRYYKVYKEGMDFAIEGTNGDYVPAKLRYKMSASLIDKEARFMFAIPPDITVEPKGDVGLITEEVKQQISTINNLVQAVLDKGMFSSKLSKAAKDCFIGKRVAGLVNFNEQDGVTFTFVPSTQFLYDTALGNDDIITKFVCFIIVQDSITLSEKRIFKKKYELINDVVYIEEELFDGAGMLLEVVTERQPILLDTIPVVIFINDGLTGEKLGESEIQQLSEYEAWYSKLANADKDAERKGMNPTRYTLDMDNNSTKNLSTNPGSFWDLGTDQNLDHPSPAVGILEPGMNYSGALKTTLDRIKAAAYEVLDMPDITLDSMQGSITSGKALKAIYWKLIVRCQEKMNYWAPQLQKLATIIIEGAKVYPNCIAQYVSEPLYPVAYEIKVEQNIPLPEDEIEEKTMDLAEVDSQVMSRKAYMKKWRGLTDDEVQEELEQIALERQILEDSAFNTNTSEDMEPYPNASTTSVIEEYTEGV